MLMIAESNGPYGWYAPTATAVSTNEIEGEPDLLMGLDLQRFLHTRLDVVSGTCMITTNSGEIRPMKYVQAAGSGLLCVRVDEFCRTAEFGVARGSATVPMVFEQFLIANDEKEEKHEQ